MKYPRLQLIILKNLSPLLAQTAALAIASKLADGGVSMVSVGIAVFDFAFLALYLGLLYRLIRLYLGNAKPEGVRFRVLLDKTYKEESKISAAVFGRKGITAVWEDIDGDNVQRFGSTFEAVYGRSWNLVGTDEYPEWKDRNGLLRSFVPLIVAILVIFDSVIMGTFKPSEAQCDSDGLAVLPAIILSSVFN